MPPRTRATKSAKAHKENLGTVDKVKQKLSNKITRPTRKVLADKTNSASDENASIDDPKIGKKNSALPLKSIHLTSENDKPNKARRDRRVPSRVIDLQVLKPIPQSKENNPVNLPAKNDKKTNDDSHVSADQSLQTSFKTPEKVAETSLVAARPRRVCRLPSKFNDHSISPSKFIPVQPSHASTPLAQKNVKPHAISSKSADESNIKANSKNNTFDNSKKVEDIRATADSNNNAQRRALRSRKLPNQTQLKPNDHQTSKETPKKEEVPVKSKEKPNKSPSKTIKKKSPVKKTKVVIDKTPAKDSKTLKTSPRKKAAIQSDNSPIKRSKRIIEKNFNVSTTDLSPLKTSPKKNDQRPFNKNFSYRVLGENHKNESKADVYEFTYDPDEEPTPKKKKKRVVKKRPAKPKTIIIKNNYNDNVNKALAALKHVVAKKPVKLVNSNIPEIKITNFDFNPDSNSTKTTQNIINPANIQRDVASKIVINNPKSPKGSSNNNTNTKIQIQQNIVLNIPQRQQQDASPVNVIADNSLNKSKAVDNRSIRVEDIAADFEPDIDYSPVNSPHRPQTPTAQMSHRSAMPYNNDPLNLRENESFFEQNPVASSSMNVSARIPQPSPWRVEFESLPIRWHVNSYVKANMTPAVECSFVNFDDKNRKKHVYTNLVPERNEQLPELSEKDQGNNMVQTSMFQYIKQIVEKSSAKKNKGRSVTPVTASLFNDTKDKTPNKDTERITRSTRQLFTPRKNEKSGSSVENCNMSDDKENSKDSSRGKKRKNEEQVENVPAKAPTKETDDLYFGFDDSENTNIENVSPKKKVDGRKRALRPRARAVLKEINEQGPTRGTIPLAAKTALNAEVERLYEEMKSASDAPVFPQKEPMNIGTTNVIEAMGEMDEDSQPSVHLFEDIEEVVHHLKLQRKSYGKAKKVTFRQASTDSDTQDEARERSENSEFEDNLDDLTFNPAVPALDEKKKKRKMTKKQKMSKKEEEEAEAWAAGFNSMCEDVEDFQLVIE